MKAALVRYDEGVAPPPYFPPNAGQFIYILEGKLRIILGDEISTIVPDDLVHMQRNVRHSQDCNKADAAEGLQKKMA
jgi:quercetin dioxygenase-like cupin family protein